jgi:hypothetical protein
MTVISDMPTEALVLFAWSRIWSPVVPPDWYREAWAALGLPDDEEFRDTGFCSTFHTGFPAPRVPLLLHAALNQPGDTVRMDWMRVMSHLGIAPGEHMLPPDHLAIDCEIFASAVARSEDVIVRELSERYLSPWCDTAIRRLSDADPRLGGIVEQFRAAIGAAAGVSALA